MIPVTGGGDYSKTLNHPGPHVDWDHASVLVHFYLRLLGGHINTKTKCPDSRSQSPNSCPVGCLNPIMTKTEGPACERTPGPGKGSHVNRKKRWTPKTSADLLDACRSVPADATCEQTRKPFRSQLITSPVDDCEQRWIGKCRKTGKTAVIDNGHHLFRRNRSSRSRKRCISEGIKESQSSLIHRQMHRLQSSVEHFKKHFYIWLSTYACNWANAGRHQSLVISRGHQRGRFSEEAWGSRTIWTVLAFLQKQWQSVDAGVNQTPRIDIDRWTNSEG